MYLTFHDGQSRLPSILQRSTVLLYGALLGSLLPAMAGCGANDSTAPMYQQPPVVTGEGSLEFEHEGALKLKPGEVTTVTVVGDPPQSYGISFYLVGDALDASIHPGGVVADSVSGRATVTLRAPNQATNFILRATIDEGVSVDLQVAVSDQGFGSLSVSPVYNGSRPVGAWIASYRSGTTCAELEDSYPSTPEAFTLAAPPGDALLFDSVPVGPNLAVTVRSGHYAWGCTDAADLVAETTSDVKVTIKDAPIDLRNLALDVALEFTPEDPSPYGEMIDATEQLIVAAFFAQETPAKALHDAMAIASVDPVAFNQASSSNGWQDALDVHLDDVDLAADVLAWSETGLNAQPATLSGTLTSLEGSDTHALFTFMSLGNITAADAGVPSDYVMKLSVDPDDTVRLGGTLFWLPSRYLSAIIEQAALAEITDADSFDDVLHQKVDCDGLVLAGFEGCDESCMVALCKSAVVDRWQFARDASTQGNTSGELPFEASGAAAFDDWAGLTGFDGSWLGNIASYGLTVKVSGEALATPQEQPPP